MLPGHWKVVKMAKTGTDRSRACRERKKNLLQAAGLLPAGLPKAGKKVTQAKYKAKVKQSKMHERVMKFCILPNDYEFGSARVGDMGMEEVYTSIFNRCKWRRSPRITYLAKKSGYSTKSINETIKKLVNSGHIIDTGREEILNCGGYEMSRPIYEAVEGLWVKHINRPYLSSARGDKLARKKSDPFVRACEKPLELSLLGERTFGDNLLDFLHGERSYRVAYMDPVWKHVGVDVGAFEAYMEEPGDKSIGAVNWMDDREFSSLTNKTGARLYHDLTVWYGGHKENTINERAFVTIDGEAVETVDMTACHPRLFWHSLAFDTTFLGLLYREDHRKALEHSNDARRLFRDLGNDPYSTIAAMMGISRADAKAMWAGLMNVRGSDLRRCHFSNSNGDYSALWGYLTEHYPAAMDGLKYVLHRVNAIPSSKLKRPYNNLYNLLELLEERLMLSVLEKMTNSRMGVRIHDALLVRRSDAAEVRKLMEAEIAPTEAPTLEAIKKAAKAIAVEVAEHEPSEDKIPVVPFVCANMVLWFADYTGITIDQRVGRKLAYEPPTLPAVTARIPVAVCAAGDWDLDDL